MRALIVLLFVTSGLLSPPSAPGRAQIPSDPFLPVEPSRPIPPKRLPSPPQQPKGYSVPSPVPAQSINFGLVARTAGDLAALCATDPNSQSADDRINFCHGFAQGAINQLFRAGKKNFCFPSPTPTRSATMREFVGWVRGVPANGNLPALEGLFRFLGERFPCK